MNISANGKRLAVLTLQLVHRWQDTKVHWQDIKSREFEREYLDLLVPSVEKAATVIEQLDKLVMKVRKDCE